MDICIIKSLECRVSSCKHHDDGSCSIKPEITLHSKLETVPDVDWFICWSKVNKI